MIIDRLLINTGSTAIRIINKKANIVQERRRPMEEQKKEDRRVRRTKKMLTQALTQLMQEKQIKEITVK